MGYRRALGMSERYQPAWTRRRIFKFIGSIIGLLVFAYLMIFQGGELVDEEEEYDPPPTEIVQQDLGHRVIPPWRRPETVNQTVRSRTATLWRFVVPARIVNNTVDVVYDYIKEDQKAERRREEAEQDAAEEVS